MATPTKAKKKPGPPQNRVSRECQKCGGTFSVPPNVVKAGNGLFCSRECRREHAKVLCTCQTCGKQFTLLRSQVKEGRGKFCGKKCQRSEHLRRAKKPQTSTVCQCCGKVYATDTLLRKRMYCSKKCQFKARTKPESERKKPWRTSKSPEDTAWVKAVLLRDRACVRCGRSEPLQAHHVKSWKDHPELRRDVDNGVALCPCCHHAQHPYLPLEAFTRLGGKRVLHCIVCETAYIPLGKQRTCSKKCGMLLHFQRKKQCQ